MRYYPINFTGPYAIRSVCVCVGGGGGGGSAVLKSDWSRAGLRMDLLVFVYSYTKTGYLVLQIQML